MTAVKHPEVRVKLSGTDGNVYAVLGKVQAALRKAGVPPAEIAEFVAEATSGNYDHALATCTEWVDVS